MNWNLSDALRAVSAALQTPVILILLLLIAVTIVMLGTLIAELFTERLHMKARLPELLNELEKPQKPLSDVISESALLKRQKKALLTVCAQTELSERKREALAVELLESEKARYDLRVKITDLVMKLGPMFGLLGTLIPLGPGIIALGRGDTYTLSTSLLTAFDTTVAGLIAAAVATVISLIRKRWYARYMGQLDAVMESLLEGMEHAA
ncbi:MAG: MotA/TolQ/ExbB proton channel family protein [Oscillospiraceae bacterium]|nr:MotA/TolQ/ExbB proton channel family protein [Oscillospiraceae bacterium]